MVLRGLHIGRPNRGQVLQKNAPVREGQNPQERIGPAQLEFGHRAVWAFLQRRTDFLRRPCACFTLRLSLLFDEVQKQDNLEYVTADLNSLGRTTTLIAGIPFEDNSFDVVMANHLLDVEDDRVCSGSSTG